MITFGLDKRIRLPDGRSGFVIGGAYKGDETLGITIMLDDYILVECREDQLTKIKRVGELTEYGQDKKKLLPVEIANHERLRCAIWHSYWSRFGIKATESAFPIYSKKYREGRIEPLPGEEDIRQTDSSATRQLVLF
ncbi:unnamed protein product [marine sediment metagenome]|uniref:Uncharacterized protein n=1 Tax=marine sediment metagenome TaxID=412755 RepID=X1FG73_9ZZZZ